MARKLSTITLSCSPADKNSLEALALKHGYTWGNRPNVSALMSAIANGDLVIGEASQREKIEAQLKRLEDQLKELN
jgi:hypothetical protein